MNTVVVQSFRSTDVPDYIVVCCRSVRAWAESAGFSYRFLDDRFLDLAPGWYREKAGAHICVVTDLARLVEAHRLLLSGVDRVVWCDADLLVFRPELLLLQPAWTGTYCKEVWLEKDASGAPVPVHKVNNAMCVFTRAGLGHLEEYIDQCLAVVQASPAIVSDLSVGTNLLTAVHHARAEITTVGMVGTCLMEAILANDTFTLASYREWHGSPIYAANLCNTIRTLFGNTPGLFDFLCAGVIERLTSGVAGEPLSRA